MRQPQAGEPLCRWVLLRQHMQRGGFCLLRLCETRWEKGSSDWKSLGTTRPERLRAQRTDQARRHRELLGELQSRGPPRASQTSKGPGELFSAWPHFARLCATWPSHPALLPPRARPASPSPHRLLLRCLLSPHRLFHPSFRVQLPEPRHPRQFTFFTSTRDLCDRLTISVI